MKTTKMMGDLSPYSSCHLPVAEVFNLSLVHFLKIHVNMLGTFTLTSPIDQMLQELYLQTCTVDIIFATVLIVLDIAVQSHLNWVKKMKFRNKMNRGCLDKNFPVSLINFSAYSCIKEEETKNRRCHYAV